MSQAGAKGSFPGNSGIRKHQQKPLKKDGDVFSMSANKGSSGKFMSHLLGLDHDPAANPKGEAAATEKIKFSDYFRGFKLTSHAMFFLLFLGFFLWLFVIYWVRHHEPLADQMLGTPRADSRSPQLDSRIVGGTRTAIPRQSSATSGAVYVPGAATSAPAGNSMQAGTIVPQQQSPPFSGQQQVSQAQASLYGQQQAGQAQLMQPYQPQQRQQQTQAPLYAQPQAGPIQAPLYAQPQQGQFQAAVYGGQPQYAANPATTPSAMSGGAAPFVGSSTQAGPAIQAAGASGNYFVQSSAGPRVKTIVSR